MIIRRIQVLLVGLIAISALEHSAWQTTQAEAQIRRDRLARAQTSTPLKAKTLRPAPASQPTQLIQPTQSTQSTKSRLVEARPKGH